MRGTELNKDKSENFSRTKQMEFINYLNKVVEEIIRFICSNNFNNKKDLIRVFELGDEDVTAGKSITCTGCFNESPVVLYTSLDETDEGFLLIHWILIQLQTTILANLNEANYKNSYCFYSEHNRPLTPKEAAEYVYEITNTALSNTFKEMIGIQFNDLDLLSLTNYESKKPKGELVFVNIDNKLNELRELCVWTVDDTNITFNESNIKYIRKLLVGCADGALLFVKDSEHDVPFFLGVVNSYNKDKLPIHVFIKGYLKWSLTINGKEAFRKNYNRLSIKNDITADDIMSAITTEFSRTKVEKDNILNLINSLCECEHGAALVLLDGTNSNSSILNWLGDLKKFKKMISIETSNFDGNYSFFEKTSAMDGAVVLDVTTAKVISVGAIVDGKTKVEGDPSRGSRYNSLKNFTYIMAEFGEPIVTVVFSEDGDRYIFSGKNSPC